MATGGIGRERRYFTHVPDVVLRVIIPYFSGQLANLPDLIHFGQTNKRNLVLCREAVTFLQHVYQFKQEHGELALGYACLCGNLEIVQCLVSDGVGDTYRLEEANDTIGPGGWLSDDSGSDDSGSDDSASDDSASDDSASDDGCVANLSALQCAIRGGNMQVIKFLLSLDNLRIEGVWRRGRVSIPMICKIAEMLRRNHKLRDHEAELITLIVKHPNFDVNEENEEGTILHHCCKHDYDDNYDALVEALLALDTVSVNAISCAGYSALTEAAIAEDVVKCQLLLRHPMVEINLASPWGTTALDKAKEYNSVEVIPLLLKSGAVGGR